MDWTLVGSIAAVAALLFGIYTFYKSRKPKRLQHEVRIDQEIVSHSRYTRWADLSVHFGDRDLKRPRVVVVRVTNTGKVEARSNDFEEPLTVSATEGNEIIAATIALRKRDEEENQEIEPASLGPTEVVAPKTLLNEGEWLEFRLLVEGEKKPVRLRGHAAGFRLATYTPRRGFWTSMAATLILVTVGAGLASVSTLLIGQWNTVQVPNVVGKPLDQAIGQINGAGLKLGTLHHARGAKVGIIVVESPPAGTRVDKDSSITLIVSDGP